jgi:hypothetical protein
MARLSVSGLSTATATTPRIAHTTTVAPTLNGVREHCKAGSAALLGSLSWLGWSEFMGRPPLSLMQSGSVFQEATLPSMPPTACWNDSHHPLASGKPIVW